MRPRRRKQESADTASDRDRAARSHALAGECPKIVKRPFLEDSALLSAYLKARALILPSEIEGFGLPALEAYYLGTPVCFVKALRWRKSSDVVTDKGGFSLIPPNRCFPHSTK